MTAAAARPNKIERLIALIEHPRTSPEERAAGERMLERAMKALEDAPRISIEYGDKYAATASLSTTEVAKLIRQDIKVARKVGVTGEATATVALRNPIADAPAEIKFGVRTEYFAGGSSIVIKINNIPEQWGYEERVVHGHPAMMPTTALQELADDLAAVMAAYNYDGSDTRADYWHVRFYAQVLTDDGTILAA